MKKIAIFLFVFVSYSFVFGQSQISDSDKVVILNEHNFYRDAIGVRELTWSDSLASFAQTEANKIAKNPYSTDLNTFYGENIYRSTVYPKPVDIVNFWVKEQRYYHGEFLTESGLSSYGHYTQMIASATVNIGCGIAETAGGTYIVVCFYFPKGNIVGQKP